MEKTLTVATEVQRAIFEQIILPEIRNGFWQGVRPMNHASHWNGVNIVLGPNLGPAGFKSPRNYNFINPKFLAKSQDKILALAQTISPGITLRQVKKQLLMLNQIIGGRIKELGGEVIKLQRGKKPSKDVLQMKEKRLANVTVRKMLASFVEEEIRA